MADQTSIAQLSLSLEKAYSAVVNERIQANDIFFDTISRGHEVLINMMDQLAAGQTVPPAPELIESIELIATQSPALTQSVDADDEEEHDALHEYFSDMVAQDDDQPEQDGLKESASSEFEESQESEVFQPGQDDQDRQSHPSVQEPANDLLEDDASTLSPSTSEDSPNQLQSDNVMSGPVPSYVSVINVLVDTGRKLAKNWQQNPSDRSAIERLQSNARAIKVDR